MEEEWRDIPGYEGKYQASNTGKIRALHNFITDTGNDCITHEMSQKSISSGYQAVTLTVAGKSNPVYVHRLVALAFLPNPSNLPQVNHKDENKRNNNVENLEWCTASYNAKYGTALARAKETFYRNLTDERRQAISKRLCKHWQDDEWRRNQIQKLTEAHNRPEYKAKMSTVLKGRKRSPEAVEKTSMALRGRKLSPEAAKKHRECMELLAISKRIPVRCVELDAEFDCYATAAAFAHVTTQVIRKCCMNKYPTLGGFMNKARGYTWEYVSM